MLKFGLISEIDAAKGLARVNFDDDGIVSDWLPILVPKAMEDSFSFFPDVNEHVACMMDEHAENGVVMGSMYNSQTQPNGGNADKWRVRFKDGTVIEYDRSGHKLLVDAQGAVEVKATGAIKVDGQSTIDVKGQGAIKVEGQSTVDVKATGAVKVESSAAATVKATTVTIDAPATTCTGNLTVAGVVSAAGIAAAAGPGGAGDVSVAGSMTVTGDIKTTGGDVEAPGGIKLTQHKHTGVTTGGGSTATPIP